MFPNVQYCYNHIIFKYPPKCRYSITIKSEHFLKTIVMYIYRLNFGISILFLNLNFTGYDRILERTIRCI